MHAKGRLMNSPAPMSPLPRHLVQNAVRIALEEDLGLAGDITTGPIIPEDLRGAATIVVREPAHIAGLDLAEAAFSTLDPDVVFERLVNDGMAAEAGTAIARVEGRARALLTGERTALNFLGRLCGIATLTAAYVAAIDGTRAKIACTRKTTPGLRGLEKYAVRCGGGLNHRFGLYDAVLVKDNHIAAAGGIEAALSRLRARTGHMVKIEVEVDTLDQLREVLNYPIDAVLLDNMDIPTLKEAVAIADGKVLTEASGGVTLETVAGIAQTGVDLISVGALTHSPRNLDSSLEWEPRGSSR